MEAPFLSWNDFRKVDMRVGTIISAEINKNAVKPAIVMTIDFGPLGIKKSSAQITRNYSPDQLTGRQVIAVVNFPPKQIANVMSECLVLGPLGEGDDITLLQPDQKVANGLRVG
ncbi:MAG: tRNA-binding protein [Bacteroidetes bacterium]|nr:MAG: tRNA-binding protein [Bacteroidota bacterium]